MKKRESIEQCQEKDIPQLMELFKTAYPSNPRLQELDFFKWQFLDTPFSNAKQGYNFWVIKKDNEIRSFLGYCPIEFRYKGDIKKGAWTHNWYSIDRNLSGLQLLSGFMEKFDNRFLIGLSDDSNIIYTRYRIPLLKQLPRWVGIIHAQKCIDLFKVESKKIQGMITKSQNALRKHTFYQGIEYRNCFESNEEFVFDQWETVQGYVRRTGDYLNWRYFDIPNHNYKAITGTNGEFAIFRIEKVMHQKVTVIRIVDWSFKGEWASKALSLIISKGNKAESVLIDFFCTSEEIGGELEKCGFLSDDNLDSKIPYLFRPIFFADGIRLALDLPPHRKLKSFNFNEWYVPKGDSDIDRVKL